MCAMFSEVSLNTGERAMVSLSMFNEVVEHSVAGFEFSRPFKPLQRAPGLQPNNWSFIHFGCMYAFHSTREMHSGPSSTAVQCTTNSTLLCFALLTRSVYICDHHLPHHVCLLQRAKR